MLRDLKYLEHLQKYIDYYFPKFMLLLCITYHNELINDLELPKFNKTLDNLLNSIHPSGIDLERLAIKEVTNH